MSTLHSENHKRLLKIQEEFKNVFDFLKFGSSPGNRQFGIGFEKCGGCGLVVDVPSLSLSPYSSTGVHTMASNAGGGDNDGGGGTSPKVAKIAQESSSGGGGATESDYVRKVRHVWKIRDFLARMELEQKVWEKTKKTGDGVVYSDPFSVPVRGDQGKKELLKFKLGVQWNLGKGEDKEKYAVVYLINCSKKKVQSKGFNISLVSGSGGCMRYLATGAKLVEKGRGWCRVFGKETLKKYLGMMEASTLAWTWRSFASILRCRQPIRAIHPLKTWARECGCAGMRPVTS